MLIASLMAAATSSSAVVTAVKAGVLLGSSVYLTSRVKRNPLKLPKK